MVKPSQLFKLLSVIMALLIASPVLANGRIDYIPSLDIALRKQIQLRLKEQGFYRGPVDGRIGAGSKDALTRYRSAKSIVEYEPTYGEDAQVVTNSANRDYPLTFYLTSKLIKSLFGIDYGNDTDEIDQEAQRRLLTMLRSGRRSGPVSPND